MAPTDTTAPLTSVLSGDSSASPPEEALHQATLDLFEATDPGEMAGQALRAAMGLLNAGTTSFWVLNGDEFECRASIGRVDLSGARIHDSVTDRPLPEEEGLAILAQRVAVDGAVSFMLRASRTGRFSAAEQTRLRHLAEATGAAMASARRLSASRDEATERSRDLSLLTEMSHEIVATLDLDRVLQTAVSLATRMLTFDRGAIALYDHGACDIRAVAGSDGVDAKSPALQDLAVRGAWAAGVGEAFYLSDRDEPASDAERTFVQIFGGDLERDGVESGLYLPLRDEEGIVGILLFESANAEFATPRQRELATVLANQTTVAVRNARLYHQVPLADAVGALTARKEAILAIPRTRRLIYASVAVIAIAALTLIRWPLRIAGTDPVFRPLRHAEVRPTLAGIVDRVFVHEGSRVERGAPIAHLRDAELLARRDAARASASAADRAATMAASRGAAADERLERLRADVFRREDALLDEQIRSAVVRSPVSGEVLTPRPEERTGTHAEEGDLLAVVGQTDSLELEFGVDQRDVARIHVGDEVLLRVTALPQQTFSGRVITIAPLASAGDGDVSFHVRSAVPNERGLLRPGMTAYARVLAEPYSVLGRLLRDPTRALRLFWWRIWA